MIFFMIFYKGKTRIPTRIAHLWSYNLWFSITILKVSFRSIWKNVWGFILLNVIIDLSKRARSNGVKYTLVSLSLVAATKIILIIQIRCIFIYNACLRTFFFIWTTFFWSSIISIKFSINRSVSINDWCVLSKFTVLKHFMRLNWKHMIQNKI